MFIQTEATPNPNALIFIPGCEIMGSKPYKSYNKNNPVDDSPLAEILFSIDGIEDIMFGKDFITISKTATIEWAVLKAPILHSLDDYLSNNNPVVINDNPSPACEEINEDDNNEVIERIKQLLETKVRPAVAKDGGDIIFHKYEKGVVYLEMFGACSGCPSSEYTLKMGIESMLKHYIPEVNKVEAI